MVETSGERPRPGGRRRPDRDAVRTRTGTEHARLRHRIRVSARSDDGEALASVLAAATEGDTDAIGYLYDRYADEVYGYVSSIVRDDHEAEDVTQNVFIKLMRILPFYEQRRVPFSAWLFRVARNVALDSLRARRILPFAEIRERCPDTGDGRMEREWSLHDALSALSPGQRRVVLSRHLLGLSPVEIAQRLGKSEGSIHALHHRGRRAVQARLLEMHCGPSTMAGRGS
jgi:RNA polymerase sigma-70 factor, ECF subfamily